MLSDLRFAFRQLAKSPGFTAVAVLTLALGIGASTAIFSIVRGVLLRPLEFREPERLVALREARPDFGSGTMPVCARHFLAWRERASSFEGMSVINPISANLTGEGNPEQLSMVLASANLFEVLGVPPALGRAFAAEEETTGRQRVVVISDGLWRRKYQADPGIVGQAITINDEAHVVIGVLPPWFRFPERYALRLGLGRNAQPEVFKPNVFGSNELRELMGMFNYHAIARLKRGVAPEAALVELNEIARQLVREAGSTAILRAAVTPLQEAIVGNSRSGLLVLFGAVTSVLLIGCVNLANFMLAQAERRRAEAALRLALGASRGALLRLALAETMLVAALGGALGVGLADLGLEALLRSAPADIPRLAEVRLDGVVLVFALALTTAIGLLFSLAPAWLMASSDPQDALKAGARTVAGSAGSLRFCRTLVAAEVGLSVVLLVTSSLLGGSFLRLMRAEKGFDAPQALAADVAIPLAKYSRPEQRIGFFEQVLARLETSAGVASAALVSALPLQGETWVDRVNVLGAGSASPERHNVNVRFSSSSYFPTMGIPILAGRTFEGSDRGQQVAVISQQLAQLLWPGQNPVGRRFERNPGDAFEVIGVAGDVRAKANQPPVAMMYRPHWDWPPRRLIIIARAHGDSRTAAGALREAIRGVDRDVPIPAMQTMTEIFDDSIAQQRFHLRLAAIFAGSAILLTALGIYGVVAYSVTRRRKELGIRLAFGAQPAALQRMVLRQGMKPVALGLLLGIAVAFATGSVLASLLYETSPRDPWTLMAVVGALAVVAATACYLPARQTTKIDPVEALRAE